MTGTATPLIPTKELQILTGLSRADILTPESAMEVTIALAARDASTSK